MINIDLSKTPSLRIFVYLLSLIPGLFFLVSVALGNPLLAKEIIERAESIHSIPPYIALFLSLASAFAIGQTFVFAAWILELAVWSLIRLPKAAFTKLFASRWFYRWSVKYQGPLPKHPRLARVLGYLHLRAHGISQTDSDAAEARSVRSCLGAATEKLLERRYGIDRIRATGRDHEWGVWYSVLGRPLKRYDEGRNVGKVTLASGLAGFCALSGIAPNLQERYFFAMCSVFVFSGLWNALYHFSQFMNPINADLIRLRSILLELQELFPDPPGSPENTPED